MVPALAGAIGITACGQIGGNTVGGAPGAVVLTSAVAQPRHTIVHQTSRSYDNEPNYCVAIDPVEISDDGFTATVKQVITSLATEKGNADFTAFVFDDQETAINACVESAGDDVERHLIAAYRGGLPMSVSPVSLRWFPAASADTTAIGRWVGAENWNP